MSFALMLSLVMLAVYGVASLVLSLVVAVLWYAGFARSRMSPGELLALRLLPAGGGIFFVLSIVLPAFLLKEPRHLLEPAGPLLAALALLSLINLGAGLRRGRRACLAARALFADCAVSGRWSEDSGQADIIEIDAPIVAVLGGWQPRIVAARPVVAACTREEFSRIVAHEAAHVSGRDNLKLLCQLVSPDPLAWLPLGAALMKRWRVAVEFAADECATGADPRKRVALAAALIKVARLSGARARMLPELGMPVAVDDVDGRVRQLLAPSTRAGADGRKRLKALAACMLVVPMAALPVYPLVHELIEALVAFGR